MFEPIVPKLEQRGVTVRKLATIPFTNMNTEQALDLAFRIRCTAFFLLTRNPMWLDMKRPVIRITED